MLNRDRFVTTLAVLVTSSASAQAPRTAPLQPWSGSARREIAVQGPGYSEQQTPTWTMLGGAPTKQGAMQIQAATWTVPGKGSREKTQGQQTLKAQWTTNVPGMSAPIAVLIRASDGKANHQALARSVTRARRRERKSAADHRRQTANPRHHLARSLRVGIPGYRGAVHTDDNQRFELAESDWQRRPDATRRFASDRILRLEFRKECGRAVAASDDDPITHVGLIETAEDLCGSA